VGSQARAARREPPPKAPPPPPHLVHHVHLELLRGARDAVKLGERGPQLLGQRVAAGHEAGGVLFEGRRARGRRVVHLRGRGGGGRAVAGPRRKRRLLGCALQPKGRC
jgi:hypothetical protein